MGKILLWVTTLAIAVAIIAALIAWLAPLIGAVIVLYVCSKMVISSERRRMVTNSGNNSTRPVDTV